MRREIHRPIFVLLFILAGCAFVVTAAAQSQTQTQTQGQGQTQGQSLADIARQQKGKKQQDKAKTASKVYGNEDLAGGQGSGSGATTDSANKSTDTSTPASTDKLTAAQWADKIRGQKQAISNLQNQADKLKASIHYVVANEYTNGVEYNQAQKKKQEELDHMQQQLESGKKQLLEMQDACHKQSFGNSVCDAE